ncbi:MAG: hypothetical protein KatS3mg057_1097 [Herpetosiphonaceae bacterium]|nr:MAG: hypothetical protein KatS3mg057_1097 [Herpetosiphonaceae bacterium]
MAGSYTYADAERLLYEWVTSESLRKHCLAVAAAMRHVARKEGYDEDVWATAGLLHDLDYERHPSLDEHPFVAVAYLRDHGWPEEIWGAILSHARLFRGATEHTNAQGPLCRR